MATTDNGNQNIHPSYQFNATAQNFGKFYYQVLKDGIYNGGTLYIDSGDDVLIGAFNALFRTSTGEMIRVNTDSQASLTITEATPYITAQFVWIDSTSNYLDFTAKASGSIVSNDIVFGMGVYVTGVLTSFDYSEKTYGLIDTDGNIYGNAATLSDFVQGKVIRAADDDSGLASTTTFTNVTEASSGSGSGQVVLQGSGTLSDSEGFIKIYIGTTEAYIPYWTDIVGS